MAPHRYAADRGEWRSDVQCRVVGLRYDFEERLGVLVMADGDCCDMRGCIKLFQGIDAAVKRIDTYSGTALDTAYFLHAGKWEARSPT